jgi:hypothetical protein
MESHSPLFAHWDQYMVIGGSAFVALGILILLYYEFRLLLIKDYKEKFDYVNLHEVRYFWYAVISFIVAAFLFANTVFTHRIELHGMLWFWVRIFITVSLSIILYFLLDSSVRIYYPRVLEKRLRKLRNKPRVSPDGNLMRKLEESEESHHLEADLLAQQNNEVHSVDYDVWIDEKTGYKKVEKYMAYEHAEECSECGYFTMRIYNEEVEKKPTMDETGLLLKHFRCSYCNHREQREVVLSKLSENV